MYARVHKHRYDGMPVNYFMAYRNHNFINRPQKCGPRASGKSQSLYQGKKKRDRQTDIEIEGEKRKHNIC